MRNFSFRDEVKSSPPPSNHTQPRRKHSTQRGTSWWLKIFAKVRTIFIFLLLAAIATFVLAHINELNAIAAEKAHLVESTIQKHSAKNSIRQDALKYEKEVNSAATAEKP